MPEAVVYVNDKWHTEQIRDASYELACSGRKVLDSVIPRVELINEDLDWLEATVGVRKALVPEYVPAGTRRKWDNDERWVFQFLASLRAHHTPARIDRRVTRRMQRFEYFRSSHEALNYLNLAATRFNRILTIIEGGRIDTFRVTLMTYAQSRLLRLALYEGDYYAKMTDNVEN